MKLFLFPTHFGTDLIPIIHYHVKQILIHSDRSNPVLTGTHRTIWGCHHNKASFWRTNRSCIADAEMEALLAKLKLLFLFSQCETAVQHLTAQARDTVMDGGATRNTAMANSQTAGTLDSLELRIRFVIQILGWIWGFFFCMSWSDLKSLVLTNNAGFACASLLECAHGHCSQAP